LAICLLAAKKGVIKRTFDSISLLQKHTKVMIIITIWISAFSTLLFSFLMNVYADLPGLIILEVALAVFTVFIVLIGVMCPLLILNSISKTHFKSLSDTMDKQINAQVAHYEAMVKMHEELRRFQHDYHNLHLGLYSALMQKDFEKALSYLQSDEMSLCKISNAYETGNVVLDVLLGEKQIFADGFNTKIRFEGIMPGNLLSTADICIVFGNALDNAIEACAKLPKTEEKVITVKVSQSRKFLFIRITNPVISNVQINNNSIVTTKADKQAHGIGMHSIHTIAKKHSGTVSLSCEDNVFSIEIDFNFN